MPTSQAMVKTPVLGQIHESDSLYLAAEATREEGAA
jgi:hypothetical protein